jgi:seryl-tRNA synthetase
MTVMNELSRQPVEAIIDYLLAPAGAPGVYARTEVFERVLEGLMRLISANREPAESFVFPPVMSRTMLETSGYLKSFPHLLGCVCAMHGTETSIRGLVEKESWVDGLGVTDLVLTPAACYPLYPLVAARGPVPMQGQAFDVSSYCFRREVTHEPGRLQSFRMRENVCIGAPAAAFDFRKRWLGRAENMVQQLCLPYRLAPASDPFFGRVGQMMALSQVEQELKFEMLIPVMSPENPTACMSFNYHQDHFGEIWNMRTTDGALAHTACVAFGLERITLALFATHGLEPSCWPAAAREALGI